MNRAQLEHAIRAAGAISGDRELYVVGSQAILGLFPDAPEELIEGSIGELSMFHETFGFYVDGVGLRRTA